MENRNARYWNNKAARSIEAKKHLDYVSSKYAAIFLYSSYIKSDGICWYYLL